MIHIVMDGMCDGCEHADLEVFCIDYCDGKAWDIRCIHEMACYAMKRKCREDGDHDESD